MPHDRNGRLVERGDIVRGRGYNIKYEIVGPVFEVHESDSCNVVVGLVSRIGPAAHAQTHGYVHSGEMYCVGKEYGAAKDFEIVMKHDGKVPDVLPEPALSA